MRLSRDGRRTLAQFLIGLAVACFAGLVLVPLADGSLEVGRAVMGAMGAALLLTAAILISVR